MWQLFPEEVITDNLFNYSCRVCVIWIGAKYYFPLSTLFRFVHVLLLRMIVLRSVTCWVFKAAAAVKVSDGIPACFCL